MQIPESCIVRGTALLAELDADLLDAVPVAERSLAGNLRVATLKLSRGRWRPPASPSGALHGLLIGQGIVFRCVTAGGFATGDLLGEGDVVTVRTPPPELPWGGPSEVTWQVIDPVVVGVLDARLAAWTARWPTLTWRLLERQARHAEATMARLSLVHRQRVEERLLLALWDLAGRWGKVTPEGVLVPIPLRHHQLAALVASLRPSVTLGMRRLAERHVVERSLRGYLLQGPFDEAWARLTAEPAPARLSG
jgi:CRP/FNR family transcriptional regulator, cyclic AMP receptor protein